MKSTGPIHLRGNMQTRRRFGPSLGVLCAWLGCFLLSPFAIAQEPVATSAESPEVAEARARYRRGMDLFEEGNLPAALVELRRSYSLSREFRVLYNVAQVCFRLGDYVCSLESFDTYLAQGGSSLAPERVDDVRGYIDRLRPRIGYLAVIVEAGAEVTIDHVPRGKTPILSEIALAAGPHEMTVVKRGKVPVTRSFDVPGMSHHEERVTLVDSTVIVQAPPAPSRWNTPSFLGLAGAGVLTAGAVASAVLGVNASKQLARTPYALGQPEPEALALQSKVRFWRTTADVLGVSAVLTLGVTLYLTLRARPAQPPVPGSATASPPFGIVF